MNILVVIAHPLKDSLCSTLADHIISNLKSSGHDVVIENLYDNEFDPVLSSSEREVYYEAQYDSSKIVDEVNRLKHAEGLVLIFPTWWFGFPAILKGWFDRVWAPTVAYDHASDFGPIRPKLNNLKKTFVVTTLGAPWWVDFLVLWRPVKRIIRFALLGACARKCKLKYLSFYTCEKVSTKRLDGFMAKIDAELKGFID